MFALMFIVMADSTARFSIIYINTVEWNVDTIKNNTDIFRKAGKYIGLAL
jgi:hypothetical protein